MTSVNLIPQIGERIERLDTALFSGPASCWRYPACIIRKLRSDRTGKRLSFKMTNISLLDNAPVATPAVLFCYNKRFNFYVTVEGQASIVRIVDEPGAPEGWLDPILKAQRTYLIRFDIEKATSHFRHGMPNIEATAPAANQPIGAAVPAASRPANAKAKPKSQPMAHWPAGLLKKPPKIHWPSFGIR